MVANTEPIFGLTPNLTEVTVTSGDTTVAVTVWTAGANGGKLQAIAATSNDTAAINAKVYIRDGSNDFLVGTVNIPTLAGTDGTENADNLLNPTALPWLDALGELALPTGYSVKVGCLATMTAAKTLTLVGIGVDF